MNQSLSPAQSKVAAENACILDLYRQGTTKREVIPAMPSHPSHADALRPVLSSLRR